MHLTLLQGGLSAGADAPPSGPEITGLDLWLELAEPGLRLLVVRKLAGLSTAGRERAAEDLAPLATAGLRDDAELRAALTPFAPEALASAICLVLGQVGDRETAVAPLADVLGSSPSTLVRQQAACALGRLGGPAAHRALTDALVGDRDDEVRARAARALGRLGDLRAAPALCTALADPSEAPSVRGEAAEALGVLGRDHVVPALIDALSDSEPEVRVGATCGLGLVGSIESIASLRALLDDHRLVPDLGTVAECAAAAIGDIRRRALVAV